MHMNIDRLKFERKQSCIVITLKTREADFDADPQYFWAARDVPYILKCLRGTSKIYPYFDDTGYLMRFTDRGATHIHLKGKERQETTYFIFDGEWFAKMMQFVWKSPEGTTWEAPYDVLVAERERVAPVVKWDYANAEVEEALWRDKDKEGVERLKECIESLEHSAASYSDGNEIVIQIRFDDWRWEEGNPHSYFWTRYDKESGKRLGHGGLNVHKGKEEGTWRYSVNT